MHQNKEKKNTGKKCTYLWNYDKKHCDFANLLPYGVMGDQQGLIYGNQFSQKGWCALLECLSFEMNCLNPPVCDHNSNQW